MMIEQPSEYVSKKEYEIKVACYAKDGKSHFRFFFLPAVAHYFFSVGVEVEEIDDETWLFKGSAQRRPHFTREGKLTKNTNRHVEPFGKSPAIAAVNSDGSIYIRCPIETRVALLSQIKERRLMQQSKVIDMPRPQLVPPAANAATTYDVRIAHYQPYNSSSVAILVPPDLKIALDYDRGYRVVYEGNGIFDFIKQPETAGPSLSLETRGTSWFLMTLSRLPALPVDVFGRSDALAEITRTGFRVIVDLNTTKTARQRKKSTHFNEQQAQQVEPITTATASSVGVVDEQMIRLCLTLIRRIETETPFRLKNEDDGWVFKGRDIR